MSTKEENDNSRTINLSAKKTELGWLQTSQSFFESATDLWFKWMGWLFVLGVLDYLYRLSGNLLILTVMAISYLLITMYAMYFIISIRIEPYDSWASGQTSNFRRYLAFLPVLIVSGLSIYLIQVGIRSVVQLLQLTHGS